MHFQKKKCSCIKSTCLQEVQRLFKELGWTKYVCSTAPSWSTIMMTAKKFEKTGSVNNLQARKRNTSQKRKNAKIILEKVMSEKPSKSIRKASQIVKI